MWTESDARRKVEMIVQPKEGMSLQRSETRSKDTVKLIERCRSISETELTENARERDKTLLLDTLGVMLRSVTQTESSTIARDMAIEV